MRWPRRYRPRPEQRPTSTRPSDFGLGVRWLGTAGQVVRTPTTTVLIDPFLSRPSVGRTLATPLRPTPWRWWSWLPEKVDAVVIGHSHFDHLLDAPEIARRKGALLVGSQTTVSVARAEGVPELQLCPVGPGGGIVQVGDITVRMIPSRHGRLLRGWVPFPGEHLVPPRLPLRLHDYRLGGAYGVHLETPVGSVYHNGSADLVDAELEGLRADVLLVGLAGRRGSVGYLRRLAGLLEPTLVVPTHHDFFFHPLEDGVRLLPGVAFDGFVADMEGVAPRARIVSPTYEDELLLPPDGTTGDAVFAPRDMV